MSFKNLNDTVFNRASRGFVIFCFEFLFTIKEMSDRKFLTQIDRVKDLKLRLILYGSDFFPCTEDMADKSDQTLQLVRRLTNLAGQLEFSVETKECLENRLFATLKDLLCGDDRKKILDYILGFIKNWITRNNADSRLLEMTEVLAPLFNNTTQFEILLNQMCPVKTKSRSAVLPKEKRQIPVYLVYPARAKRQFGLLNTLHLLKSIFCDEEIVGAAMKELQRRSKASHTVIYVVSNYCWCCLIMGEWDSIADNQQEN